VPRTQLAAAAPLVDVSTVRLSIRRLGDGDLEELAEVFRDPEVWWFEYGRGLERAETVAFLDRQKQLWDDYGFGGCAVRDRREGALLGVVGLGARTFSDPLLPHVTVGWRFASGAWGHGFATEAAVALLRQAFGPMRIPAVGCVTNRENSRSLAVARRLRMEVIGAHRVLRDDGLRSVVALLLRVDHAQWAGHHAEPRRPTDERPDG
jgi:RimJ/RimL family protein N-acetyltransferase